MEYFHGPSSSQFTFDDYDFSMDYEDFKHVRDFVKSKVGLLKGNSLDREPPGVFRGLPGFDDRKKEEESPSLKDEKDIL